MKQEGKCEAFFLCFPATCPRTDVRGRYTIILGGSE